MATHRRQQIREAVATLLAGKTAAGARVYETRIVPFRQHELPAIAVYSLEETSDDQQTAPRELKRMLSLAIEGAVAGDNIDDAMDALALEIENAMHRDPTLGEVCGDSTLTATDIDVFEDGSKPIGSVRLRYAVTYYTPAPDPSEPVLDNLETIRTETKISETADPAVDVVTFEPDEGEE